MSTFTIPFPEYDIADILQKKFSKKDGYSIAIPLSRQQEFYDLLVLNGKNKKSVTIQVKSSRTYPGRKTERYQFYSWFKWLDIKDNYSDFYFMYITYPQLDKNLHPGAKWERRILVFNQKEMHELLGNLKNKKGEPAQHSFYFGLNADDEIVYGGRGLDYPEPRKFKENLLANKLAEIKKKLV